MFKVRRENAPIPHLVLEDEAQRSSVKLFPSRGALVTSWRVRDREMLYLDEATLMDPGANVRGGIPVLFPSPGKLAGDAFSLDGKEGHLKQHGFARNLPWEVVSTQTSNGARATLRLVDDASTRTAFPYEFKIEVSFSVAAARLHLEVRVENPGKETLPFGFGLHPYFVVPDKARARVPTSATRAFDNVLKKEVPFAPVDFNHGEVDLHLIDHDRPSAELQTGEGLIRVQGSAELRRWVLWTLPGKPFVCLEPWTCPANALNTGEQLMRLAPGEAKTLRIEFLST